MIIVHFLLRSSIQLRKLKSKLLKKKKTLINCVIYVGEKYMP